MRSKKLEAGVPDSLSTQPGDAVWRPRMMSMAVAGALAVFGVNAAHAEDKAADAAAAESAPIPTVQITGQAGPGDTTEGTGSYTTRSMNTATRLDMSVRETPQSISVVTRQQMDDLNLQSVEQIVNITPGLSLNRNGTDRSSIYSRGFAISNFTEDGLTMASESDTLGFATLAMYDRIEVLRGSAGMAIGAGTPAGTLNFVRKRPTADTRVALTGSVGRYNDYRGEVDVGGALNAAATLRARAVLAYQDTDTFISNYGHKRKLAYVTADADLSRDTTLSVGFHYNQEKNNGSTWYGLPTSQSGAFLPLDRSTSNAPDWTTWDKTNTRVFAEIEHKLGGGWKARLAGQALTDDMDSEVVGIGRVRGTELFKFIAADNFIYDREQRSYDVQASGPFTLLGRQHEIVFGANYRNRHTSDKGLQSVPAYDYVFDPVNWDSSAPQRPVMNDFYYGQAVKQKQQAVYATARFSLAEPLSLLLGARVDWYDYALHNTFTGARSGYKIDNEKTPYVGLVYDLNGTYSLYGSWTSIFNPQSAVDRNGVLLDPVTGINMEAGVKGEYFGGALNASAAVFRIKQKNLANALPVGQCSPGVLSCSESTGEVQSEGVELTLAGELARDWQASAGVTLNSAKYAKAQGSNKVGARFAAERPTKLLRLATSYRLPGNLNAWRVGAAVRAQNRIFRTNVPIRQSGYAIVDLNAGWQATRQLDVSLSVTNLFDRSYYQSISALDSGNAFGDPLSYNVTARYRF